MQPIIREAQKAGARTLREIAEALNARGIPTARGGQWYAQSVANVLARALRAGLIVRFSPNSGAIADLAGRRRWATSGHTIRLVGRRLWESFQAPH
jgi:hypothetical protein